MWGYVLRLYKLLETLPIFGTSPSSCKAEYFEWLRTGHLNGRLRNDFKFYVAMSSPDSVGFKVIPVKREDFMRI